MRLDDALEALATRQHSLVATWQLDGLGATCKEIDRLTDGPRWRALTPRVLVLRGSVDTTDQQLMAAVLDASPGAAIAGRSAAAMWGVPGFRAVPAEQVRHRGVSRRAPASGLVHEVMDLRPHHLRLIRGIPVTSPTRTVFDLAGQVAEGRLERVVDWLWSARLLDGAGLHAIARELCRRGRTGSAVMRRVVEARGVDYVPPATALEGRFAKIVRDAGLPDLRRQVDSGGEVWTGRVDFRDREVPLVVEVQCERWHSALVDVAADAARRERLEADGFVVVEVWDHDVWHDPASVIAAVRVGRADARARRKVAS